MPAVVARIQPRNVEEVFQRTPYLLVRLDRGAASFHPGVAEYFDRRFPRGITFGTMARSDWAADQVASMFQSSLGPLRRGVADGYYLFDAGYVVGYHGTAFRPPSVTYGNDPEEVASRERVADSPASRSLSPLERENLRQLASYFDAILERRQRAAGFSDDGTFSSSAGSAGTEPPPPPRSTPAPAPSADDPYVILGVSPSASAEEIKTAYKTQMKLNHPDRVAHLSPALQAFAQQQTLTVKGAYEAILRRRAAGG